MGLEDIYISITEKAALASFHHIGQNNSKQADQAATEAMRSAFKQAPIDGKIVIGEGERDQAPMLYIGEKVGRGEGFPEQDIAVDPLEGTGLCARGEEGSLCVLAAGGKNKLLHAPDVYMDKLACQQKGLSIQNSVSENIQILSKKLNKPVSQLKVAVLKRDRHKNLIQELESLGVDLILFQDGDVLMSLLTCIKGFKESIDLLLGSGGAPEGVLSSAGLRSLGGDFQGKLLWKDSSQKERALKMGLTDPDQIFSRDQLVQEDCIFCATAVTSNPLLKGIQREGDHLVTETLVLSPRYGKNYKVIKNTHLV
ncbi:MAG: class II fructose-bisphosphatase [Bdellovibrionales bacterium]|nr:class II fructose-bisphosphatase [Bdellovibrionales bacterium]